MEVILKEDIVSLGKAGDIVKVKDGYARNYLLSQNKAVVADPKNVRMLEHNKRVISGKQSKMRKTADDLKTKIEALSITIERETGEEEKIFGSVTARDIVDMLKKNDLVIDRSRIDIKSPIRQIGQFEVPVVLHSEVTAALKLWVVKKEQA